ncbi:hypothetical protein AQJ66_27840 [Streptomyces bungoensis]|uniref:Uncharacterized protein n=2 Tax=Streptomyces bungoensis TaxID=285568 RepID=A0A101STI6_9ACTN|nr:hypothetical protein [Streptomyces bungoensis]KUN79772.1 hypothetical protein AQJ66_27840 [Streptomyces bungoensis]
MTMTNAIHRPAWVPVRGHRLRVAGVHFDAVRIEGRRGEAVADRVVERGDGDAGPIVCEGGGRTRWVYFLLPPGVVHRYDWPLGVQHFGLRADRTVTYVGVPALEGETWPLRWYSEPTPTAPYVDAEALLAVTSPGCSPAGRRSPGP